MLPKLPIAKSNGRRSRRAAPAPGAGSRGS